MRFSELKRLRSRLVPAQSSRAGAPVEQLESRQLLTAVVVNSLTDAPAVSGSSISLRAAIAIANAGTTPTTITFDPTVFASAQTIVLSNGILDINNSTEPVTITGPSANLTISGNHVSGVFKIDSTATISNLTITAGIGFQNVGETEGGGIDVYGNLTLSNSIITGNEADLGGGLNSYGTTTLNNDLFSNNQMTNQGGAISTRGGTLTLTNSTLAGNSSISNASNNDGGGLFGFGTMTLTNDTIANNSSFDGGGMYDFGVATLRDVTISGNTASDLGGGFTYDEESGGLTLGNTIIAGNTAPAAPDFEVIPRGVAVGPFTVGNNLIGIVDSYGGSGWLSSDITGTTVSPVNALLGALGNNGGPTPTLLPLTGSPAIDAGSGALIPAGVTTDQRGLPRVSGSNVDIGAVEVQQATQSPVQLTGITLGTPGSWDGKSTISKVFDGNLNTYFDPANGNLTNWVGLDLGKNSTITKIAYAPRAGYEYRMYGGQFQVSSTPDFSSDVHTIYTITSIPTAGVLNTVNVSSGGGYRYIRYTGGTQWVNIAEMQVFGLQVPPPVTIVPITGTPIGVGGAWSANSTYAAAFDGNLSTSFDPANGALTDWTGLDLGSPQAITQLSFAPRAGYEYRMYGGQFQVSSTADFSSDVHTIYTVTAIPTAGVLTTVNFPSVGAYRYVRYTGGTQWVNIAEMSVAGPATPVPLSGTAIGVGGAYSAGSGITAAFDGNLSTYFDPANGSLTNWVGLDLGSAQTITQIKFAARAGYEFRSYGAQIQGSSTADFSSDVHTIYTINAIPPAGQVVSVTVSPVTYRYIRYIGGTQWVNIAELEVDGQ